MVKIRLARGGAKKRPFYHIVAAEGRASRDGRFIERLGYFNPIARGGEEKLVVDVARVKHWESRGAQVSERVAALVREHVAAAPAAADAGAGLAADPGTDAQVAAPAA